MEDEGAVLARIAARGEIFRRSAKCHSVLPRSFDQVQGVSPPPCGFGVGVFERFTFIRLLSEVA